MSTKYKVLCLIMTFALVFTLIPGTTFAADPKIVLTTIKTDVSGATKVSGYISNITQAEVTFIMYYEEVENIIYINQIKSGNNGAFLFEFNVDAKWSEKNVIYSIGSDSGATAYRSTYTMPYMPPGFKHIENNSVIYGHDAYTLDTIYLAPQYVKDSIVYGGNIIYFKLGDSWYDLLNPNATSSDFLIQKNASESNDVKAKTAPLRYYYIRGNKTEFAN